MENEKQNSDKLKKLFEIENEKLTFGNPYLTTVEIPDGIKEIGEEAFLDHFDHEAVRFPETLEVIGKRAFEGCDKLKEIILPKNVKIIKRWAFKQCKSLEII